MMKVSELIELLRHEDPDAIVLRWVGSQGVPAKPVKSIERISVYRAQGSETDRAVGAAIMLE